MNAKPAGWLHGD